MQANSIGGSTLKATQLYFHLQSFMIFFKLLIETHDANYIIQVTTVSSRYGESNTFTVYFAGTIDGYIYKIARWKDSSKVY